uniref:Uncharacterized protein n=1 Tax=Strigops habroptila TaxID=2489341 RepID=A0A672UTQ1_STRHB
SSHGCEQHPTPGPAQHQPLGDSQQPAARVSSAPSAQSLSPSQSQRSGTHTYVPGHWKDPALQVVSPGAGRSRKETSHPHC